MSDFQFQLSRAVGSLGNPSSFLQQSVILRTSSGIEPTFRTVCKLKEIILISIQMTERKEDLRTIWAAEEVLKIRYEEQRLFEEAQTVFHIIFSSIIVFLVVFIVAFTVFLFLYHLTEVLSRRRSLNKIVEQQPASCHCSIRMPHQEEKKPSLSSTRSSSSSAPLLPLYPGRNPYRPQQTGRITSKSLFLQKLQV